MFEKFPKQRIELNEAYTKIYNEHYKSNREGETVASGAAQKMEAWLHKKVAADVQDDNNKRTLEIGAGTLNQLRYEQPAHYDIIEPYKKLYAGSPLLNKINLIYADIDEVDLKEKYDRICSVATFEHITDLPKVVAKTCLLLSKNGTLRSAIPNEGTILWRLGWMFTTGLEFRIKYKLNYETLLKHEHVNTAKEIEEVLKYFYNVNKCSCFGVSKGLAFYKFYESREPHVKKAQEYLENYLKS